VASTPTALIIAR